MNSQHATSNNKGILGTYGPTKPTVHFGLYHLEDGGKSNLLFTVPGANVEDSQKGRVNDGEWHHLAGVRDTEAGIIMSYVDAKIIGEQDDPGNNPDNGMGKVWLGNHLNRWWPVRLDEVRIWGRALSETEIARLMKSNIMAVSLRDKLTTAWGSIKCALE
ncbi:MAG: LamG domain-containing protein [Deltaproteobacteria bacterium]|nr:LamG domain-containing protein [Deltaproteobacteria bacterium]